MKKILLIFILIAGLSILTCPNIRAGNLDRRIAVLPFDGKMIEDDYAETLSAMIRTEIGRIGEFDVIDRGNMELILQEQQVQLHDCTESSCAVRFGEILNVRWMIVGSLTKFGKKYLLICHRVDVSSGKIERFSQYETDSLETMIHIVPDTVVDLFSKNLPIQQKNAHESNDLLQATQKQQEYVVKPGDTLASIARYVTGNPENYKAMAKLNNINYPYRLEVGQTLLIPDSLVDFKKGDDSKFTTVTTVQSGSRTTVNDTTLYQTAYNDYINRNFELAVLEFDNYIDKYPSTDLTDNAQYWIGECYFSMKKYSKAKSAFTEVMNGYPNGDRLKPARLKIGLCLSELGLSDESVLELEKLIQDYPYSSEARIAADRLKNLNK